MATKSISVSLINHHPNWEASPVPTPALDLTKYNVGGIIFYTDGSQSALNKWARVDVGQDLTQSCVVDEGEVESIKFFWEDRFATDQVLRRTAWHDQSRADHGKPWRWAGMFWLFDMIDDQIYEYTACGVGAQKFDPDPSFPRSKWR